MNYEPDFLIIPYALVKDPEIKPLDERVYSVVYYFTKMRGEKCTAGNEMIALIAKSSTASVANSLSRLEKKGVILRVFEDSDKTIRKEIIPLIGMSQLEIHHNSQVKQPLTHRLTPPSPTGEQISNNIISKRIKKISALEENLPDWLNKKAWAAWEEYKKQKKQKLTPFTIKLQMKKLEANKKDHVEMIRQSIENGWTGLFPLKGEMKFDDKASRKSDYARAHEKRLAEEEEKREREVNAKENDARNVISSMNALSEKFKVKS